MKTIWLGHDHQERLAPREELLRGWGFAVRPFEEAGQILAALEEDTPDLLILDVLLEGLNGFATCERVRAHPSGRELPILLCSGVYRGSRFRREAERVGAQTLLSKPTPDELLRDWVDRLTAAVAPRA